MCQGCVNEGLLSQDTHNKIEAFCEIWVRAEFGPGHITLSDDNVMDENLDFCIRLCEGVMHPDKCDKDTRETLSELDWYEDHDKIEIEATLKFLKELREIPEDVR